VGHLPVLVGENFRQEAHLNGSLDQSRLLAAQLLA
jgi:hypothetical protein